MNILLRRILPLITIAALASSAALAQEQGAPQTGAVVPRYQQAPQPIHDLLSAPPTPLVVVSPKSDQMLVAERLANPPISDLAQPMLRLAGLRINPATNGRHHPPRLVSLSLVDVATGKTRKVTGIPANAYLTQPEWSPDGSQFAFTNTTADGMAIIGSQPSPNKGLETTRRSTAMTSRTYPARRSTGPFN